MIPTTVRASVLTALLAAPAVGGPVEPGPPPRALDLTGDPMPAGAVARLGSVRLRHAGLADWVFLPDGQTVATAGGDGLVRFWDLATGRQVRTSPAPAWYAVALSRDGRLVAGNSPTGVWVRDTDSGQLLKTIPYPANVMPADVRFAPDGRSLVAWGAAGLELVDWPAGRRHELPRASRGDFSPDAERVVATAVIDSKPEGRTIIDRTTRRELYRLGEAIDASAVSRDGKRMAALGGLSAARRGEDGEYGVKVLDFPTGKELTRFKLMPEFGRGSLAYSPDGTTLAVGGRFGGCVLDPATGKVVRRLADWAERLSYSPDGKYLAAAAGPRLRVWDAASGRELHAGPGDFVVPNCQECANNVPHPPPPAVTWDGRRLASVDAVTLDLVVWDVGDGRVIRRLSHKDLVRWVFMSGVQGAVRMQARDSNVRYLALADDGRVVVAYLYDGGVRSWDVPTGAARDRVPIPAGGRLSADGRWVLGAELAAVDAATGKVLFKNADRLPADPWLNTDPTNLFAWSADGSTAVLYHGQIGEVGLTVVRLQSGRVLARLPDSEAGVNRSLPGALSADGRLLAAARPTPGIGPFRLGVWEAATGKAVAAVRVAHYFGQGLAFGARGRLLVVDDGVKGVRRVDLATGRELPGFANPVPVSSQWYSQAQGIVVTPDGKRAVAVQPDGTAVVWDLVADLAPPGKWGRDDLADWWADLAGADAGRAWRAVWRLAEVPSDEVVPFLRRSLRSGAADPAAVRRLLADLDSNTFAVREKASRGLEQLGPSAVGAVRQALAERRSAESRERLDGVLRRLGDQQARPSRAVAVLEYVGSAVARELLQELSRGPADAPETQEAKAALERLSRPAGER